MGGAEGRRLQYVFTEPNWPQFTVFMINAVCRARDRQATNTNPTPLSLTRKCYFYSLHRNFFFEKGKIARILLVFWLAIFFFIVFWSCLRVASCEGAIKAARAAYQSTQYWPTSCCCCRWWLCLPVTAPRCSTTTRSPPTRRASVASSSGRNCLLFYRSHFYLDISKNKLFAERKARQQ